MAENKLPVFDFEDHGAGDTNGNPLDSNDNNVTAGGKFIVGDNLVDSNGAVIATVNRVNPKTVNNPGVASTPSKESAFEENTKTVEDNKTVTK